MSAVDAARDVLPSWVSWAGGVAYLLFAALGSGLLTVLVNLVGGGFRAGTSSSESHWTERARLEYSARATSRVCIILIPLLFGVHAINQVGPLSVFSALSLGVMAAALSSVAPIAWNLRVLRLTTPHPPTTGYWLQGLGVVTLGLFPVLSFGLVLALIAPNNLLSPAGGVWFGATLILLIVGARGIGVVLLRWLGLARPASARLSRIVSRASARAGISANATYELRWPTANAVAFPWGQLLLFSDTTVRHLDDAEIQAIAAHELGHLGEPRRILVLRLSVMLLWLPLIAVKPIIHAYGPMVWWGALLCVLLGWRAAMGTLKRMEERADSHAHEESADEGAYGRALEKLYELNGTPAATAGKTVHPQLYDRLIAVGHVPEYPRPEPPSRRRFFIATALVTIVGVALSTSLNLVPYLLQGRPPSEELPMLMSLASGGGSARDLRRLGNSRSRQGEFGDAITLYRAAIELDPTRLSARAQLVTLLTQAGRCAEAHQLLQGIDRNLSEPPKGYPAKVLRKARLFEQYCAP